VKSATGPPDKSGFNDQTPIYNSGVLGNYVHFLESRHVDCDIDDLLRCSGLTRFEINDRGHFLSQAQINRFHRCLKEAVGDPEISYKVGRHALHMKSTGPMKQVGLQFISTEAMYKAVDWLYPKWSKAHASKTTVPRKGRAAITISVRPGVREERFQCENRRGVFEAIGELLTGQPAQVAHPRCMHRGDDACLYLVSWRNQASAVLKRTGAWAGVALTGLSIGLFSFMPAWPWIGLTLAMGIACLAVVLYGTHLENKELAGLLKEQGDTAGNLLEAVEARHSDARLVQEIGLAGADILQEKTFLETVLTSMSHNLPFSRGAIALCNDDRDRLFFVDSYGCSPEERRILKDLDLSISFNDSSDMFIQALNTGKPLFLNDSREHVADMTPSSLSIIQGLKVDALICVPLIYKKMPLGLLFFDARGIDRDHTTSDINLFMGIASQIATGIVNARSYSQMQESEQRYRLLAENVKDIIWIMDVETLKMKYINPSIETVTGFSPEEFMDMSIDQYLSPASFEQAASALSGALEQAMTGAIDPENFSMTMELEEYHKNGAIIPVEVTAGFLVDENGSPNAVLGISRDLSDRKNAENERAEIESRLQQAKKMESLGTMAGSIAHNFNNLLMVVLGNLEIAIEDLPQESAASRIIQRAINASHRAADLSSMMLTYVGQLKKESVPVDLSHTVKAVLKTMDESKMAHVVLDLDLADPMPLVAADADQMRQMISGFITNAIESLGKETGRVRISTGSMHCDRYYLATTYLKEEMPEGMYAYVEVADTGCGMDADTLGNVFDPFFSTKFTGRGLGMAAVMGIIRSHDGAVRVRSVEGEGSVFTALFPIRGRLAPRDRADSPKIEVGADGKTVLLVDDEEMIMDIGSQFLTRLGYTVLTASGGREALDIVERASGSIDCVLLDFTMPGMDGLETMLQIKEIRPDARIIISSGYTRQQIEDRFACIDRPDDYIQKPFDMKVLKGKLEAVISTSGPASYRGDIPPAEPGQPR
jgi:PAS domain S-box-containing protein